MTPFRFLLGAGSWALWLPFYLLASQITVFAIVALFAAAGLAAVGAIPLPAGALAVLAIGLWIVFVLASLLVRVWQPPGLIRNGALKAPIWRRVARAVDAPSVMAARARLPPELQALMLPVSSDPKSGGPR